MKKISIMYFTFIVSLYATEDLSLPSKTLDVISKDTKYAFYTFDLNNDSILSLSGNLIDNKYNITLLTSNCGALEKWRPDEYNYCSIWGYGTTIYPNNTLNVYSGKYSSYVSSEGLGVDYIQVGEEVSRYLLLPKGDYVLAISGGYPSFDTTINFSLDRKPLLYSNDTEPNYNKDSAINYTVGSVQEGRLIYNLNLDEEDWYKFDITTDGTYTIEVTNDGNFFGEVDIISGDSGIANINFYTGNLPTTFTERNEMVTTKSVKFEASKGIYYIKAKATTYVSGSYKFTVTPLVGNDNSSDYSIKVKNDWKLLGAMKDINDMSIFNLDCVKEIWIYDDNNKKWENYDKKPYMSNYARISKIDAGSGFWIKGESECEIKIE